MHAHVCTHTSDDNRFVDTADYSKDYSGHANLQYSPLPGARRAAPGRKILGADLHVPVRHAIASKRFRGEKVCNFHGVSLNIGRTYICTYVTYTLSKLQD